MRVFHCMEKQQILPSPPERGRGVGGEGAWPPCHRKQTRESGKEKTPEPLRSIRMNPCSSVAKTTAMIRDNPWLNPRRPARASRKARERRPQLTTDTRIPQFMLSARFPVALAVFSH